MKKLFFLLLFLSFAYNFAQLKKVYSPNMRSEAEIYTDIEGNWYSNTIVVNFDKRTIEPKRKSKFASYNDILVPEVKLYLENLEKKYGKLTLEKIFESSYGDTIGVHIVTKEKVKLENLSQFYKIKFGNIVCIDSLIKEMKMSKIFKSVERPCVYILTYTPNDFSSSEQWGLTKIDAPKAWDISKGSDTVKIGICDEFDTTSTEFLHEELRNGKVVYNFNNYSRGHGQQVAGCASARTDNGSGGIASIGFNTKLMFSPGVSWGIDTVRKAGAHIINCSFIMHQDYTPLRGAIKNCLETGVIVVAAVGNSQADNFTPYGYTIPCIVYPAAYNFPDIGRQVIAVSATQKLSDGSEIFGFPPDGDWNYSYSTDPINSPTNSFVDFSAPGVFVKVLHKSLTNEYTTASGTSLSAPMVAGLLGLIKSIYPDLTPEIAYTILKNSSEKVGYNDYSYVNNTWSPRMGYGRINAYKALKYTIENYGGTFNQDVTIPAGDTWNIQSGVTLKFNSGCALVVNGTLNVQGNSSNKVTFTRNGSSGNWGGIRFNSGSAGNVQYCNILYADYGVFASNSSPTIKYSTFRNNGTGVYCSSYSSPIMVGNDIRYSTYDGIRCHTFSSPNLTDNGYSGSNVIRNNGANGLNAEYYSNPNLNGYMTYGNSVFNNSGYEVRAYYYCTVNAERVYWGSYPPLDGEFYTGLSTINRNNPLQSDPNPGMPRISGDDNIDLISEGISYKTAVDYLALAEQKQREGKYNEAIELYLEAFKIEKNNSLGRFALIKIEECFTRSGRKDYLSFSTQNTKPLLKEGAEVYVVALELEAHQMVNAGMYKDAVNNLITILQKYNLNDDIEKHTLFRLGASYSQLFGDKNNADKYFDELKKKYPEDDLIKEIEIVKSFGVVSNGSVQSTEMMPTEETTASEETKNGLIIANYPNPFNPSTTISYTLPEDGKVQIKIFDVLGREVTTLLDESTTAGKHNIVWDGTNFASGIYFYNIQFKGQTINKKMLLVK